jgi:KDO2-lipid IV(A) lauroyltransferase
MLVYMGYRIADLFAGVMPVPAAQGLARWLARAAFALRPRSRFILESNLVGVLGLPATTARRSALAAFENFALGILDFLRLGRLDPRTLAEAVEVHGWRHLERARREGHGLILLSAHLGSWEWGAAFLASRGIPVHVLARRHGSPGVQRFFELRRRSSGVHTCDAQPLWPKASRLLRGRACVALMGDRARGPGLSPHEAPRWAAALARRTGAALVPGVIVRRPGGRHAIFLEPPLSPEACRRGAWQSVLERYARRFPEQWFAFEPYATSGRS